MSGPINLGIHWDPNFQNRTEAGFQRLQKEADGEFIRLVTPYVPVRTGALRDSAKDSTVLGSGLIRHTTPYAAAQYYRLSCLLKKTNMHQDLAEISVDDILKQTVHMDIVVEEEPDDE